jgi:Fe-S-cluster containining protein
MTETGYGLDCMACGACCVHGGDVPVAMDDRVPDYLTVPVPGPMGHARDERYERRRMATDEHGRCEALRGEVGTKCWCSIYDRRPAVCEAYEQGTLDCLDCRSLAGMLTDPHFSGADE